MKRELVVLFGDSICQFSKWVWPLPSLELTEISHSVAAIDEC